MIMATFVPFATLQVDVSFPKFWKFILQPSLDLALDRRDMALAWCEQPAVLRMLQQVSLVGDFLDGKEVGFLEARNKNIDLS